MVPGSNQHIRGCLAGRIWRVGSVVACFREGAARDQRAEYFISRDVMKAKNLSARWVELLIMSTSRFQQRVSAKNVCVDELCRAIDRTIDVALCGQMHHGI